MGDEPIRCVADGQTPSESSTTTEGTGFVPRGDEPGRQRRKTAASPSRAGDGVVIREAPGATMAMSVMHFGGYATLRATWACLVESLADWGLRSAGPLHLLYHRFGADCVGYELPRSSLAAHPGEYVTELLLPVEPAGETARAA